MNTEEKDAGEIVAAARRRALGSNPVWRRTSAVLWSGFLGACCTVGAILFVPDYWSAPPITRGRITVIFMIAWLLALVPALAASLLASPSDGNDNAQ
jgi:hypothetical protein